MKKYLTLSALVGMSACVADVALAQSNCLPREVIVSRLAEKYGETVQTRALTHNGVLVENYASSNGSWTIVATEANGVSCLMVSGSNFELVESVVFEGDKL